MLRARQQVVICPAQRYSGWILLRARQRRRSKSPLKAPAPNNITDPYLVKEIRYLVPRPITMTPHYRSENGMKKRLVSLPHGTIGGIVLEKTVIVTNQHQWVAEATRIISGRDYVHYYKVRTRSLSLRARTATGRHSVEPAA